MKWQGHDSTGNTLSWFVKLMAQHQAVQSRLRSALRASFSSRLPPSHPTLTSRDAVTPSQDPHDLPSSSAIIDADIPYLDAVIQETLRVGAPAGRLGRQATVDTTILGCPIPKGTNVLLDTRFLHLSRYDASETDSGSGGAGFDMIPESVRSASSQATQLKRVAAAAAAVAAAGRAGSGAGGGCSGPWDELHLFEPTRWLTTSASTATSTTTGTRNGGGGTGGVGKGPGGVGMTETKEVFDPHALPAMMFGGGLRGCFGMSSLPPFFLFFILRGSKPSHPTMHHPLLLSSARWSFSFTIGQVNVVDLLACMQAMQSVPPLRVVVPQRHVHVHVHARLRPPLLW